MASLHNELMHTFPFLLLVFFLTFFLPSFLTSFLPSFLPLFVHSFIQFHRCKLNRTFYFCFVGFIILILLLLIFFFFLLLRLLFFIRVDLTGFVGGILSGLFEFVVVIGGFCCGACRCRGIIVIFRAARIFVWSYVLKRCWKKDSSSHLEDSSGILKSSRFLFVFFCVGV